MKPRVVDWEAMFWWMNTTTWTTLGGDVVTLEELTPTDRDKIILMISQRSMVKRLRTRLATRAVLASPNTWPFVAEMPNAGQVTEGDPFEAYMDWLDDATDQEVIDSLPLVKRLRELNDQCAPVSTQ